MYWQPEGGWIAVPTWTLKYGVRFPLHPFISEFLSFMGIGFSQLVPNAFIHIICFIAHCHEQGIKPALDIFLNFFKLTNSKEKGFKVLTRFAHRKTWMAPPSSNKGWHASWFFLRGDDTHLLPSWGEPSKSTLGFSEVEDVREEDLKKLLQAMPEPAWPITLLSSHDWLFNHGLILFKGSEARADQPEVPSERLFSPAFISSPSSSTESVLPEEPLVRKPKKKTSPKPPSEPTPQTAEPTPDEPQPEPQQKRRRLKKTAKKSKHIVIDSDPEPKSPSPPIAEPTSPTTEPAPPTTEPTPAEPIPQTQQTPPKTTTDPPAPRKRTAFDMSSEEKQRLIKTKRPRIQKRQDIPIPLFRPIPEPSEPTPLHTQVPPHTEEQPPSSSPPEHAPTPEPQTQTIPSPEQPNVAGPSGTQTTFWPDDTNSIPLNIFQHFNFPAEDQLFGEHTDRQLIFATAHHQGRALAAFSRLLDRQTNKTGSNAELKAKYKALKKKDKKTANEKASLESSNAALQQQINILFEAAAERQALHDKKISELSAELEERTRSNDILRQQNGKLQSELHRQDELLKTASEQSEEFQKENEVLREQVKTGTPEIRQQILQEYQSSQELQDRILEQYAEGFEAAIKKAAEAGIDPDIFYGPEDDPPEH